MPVLFSVANFRGFRDEASFSFNPLTVLLGANSSGKSTLIKSILAMRQTVESRNQRSAFTANGPYVQLGDYCDFVWNHETDRDVRFEVTWKAPHIRRVLRPQPDAPSDWVTIRVELGSSDRHSYTFVSHLRVKVNESTEYALSRTEKGTYTLDYGADSWEVRRLRKFYDITSEGFSQMKPSVGILLRSVAAAFERHMSNTFYVGPLREGPKRVYLTTGETPEDVGLRGELSIDVLASATVERANQLMNEVNYWLERFGMSSQCELVTIRSSLYELLIRDPHSGAQVSIADTGFGVSQVLPIVLAGYYAPPGSTLLIEQPEIHLHPGAQSVLGDLLIELSKTKTVIVETHSEHILARIQRRIAEDVLDPTNTSVYFFEAESHGSTARRLPLDRFGQFTNWPKGFFEADIRDSMAQVQAASRKQLSESR